ncbi:MAG: thiamine phosphate synthase [Verrucomicrobiales bacterium]|nr:thiamine phosphate synthase [Verrucomicrobiales bacterium]
MKRLDDCRLYGILDTGYVCPERLPEVLREMLAGGIDVVQLRAKGHAAAEVKPWLEPLHDLTRAADVPLIVNDHPELWPWADGIHVGQEDAAVSAVRQQMQGSGLVGKSTHSLAQAEAASREAVDYIGFGPLFPTPTKAGRAAIGLETIAEAHRRVSLPIFCIGGIKRENLEEVMAVGARRVVIVSGILQAVDIAGYVADCKRLLAADA